jgi:hypothetical protein
MISQSIPKHKYFKDFNYFIPKKVPKKLRRNVHQQIKAIYDKPIANIILKGEKLKSFPLDSRMRQGCLLSSLIHYSAGIPNLSNKARRIKGIQIEKEEVKLFLLQMIRSYT